MMKRTMRLKRPDGSWKKYHGPNNNFRGFNAFTQPFRSGGHNLVKRNNIPVPHSRLKNINNVMTIRRLKVGSKKMNKGHIDELIFLQQLKSHLQARSKPRNILNVRRNAWHSFTNKK